MLIGAHVSVKGGLEKAFEKVAEFGCEAMQIFTKSQVQWAAKPLAADQAYDWLCAWEEFGWIPCMVHGSYLINLATSVEPMRQKSVAAMVDEIERAATLGIPWVVAHPGGAKGSNLEQALDHCVRSLREALEQTDGSGTGILIENTAGMGSSIGSRLEELGHMLERIGNPERLGACLDTCHAFAAGYDFRTAKSYAGFWSQFEAAIGLRHLKAFHLNDCKTALGSRVDRHAPVGQGNIGEEACRLLLKDPRFKVHPAVVELKDEFVPDSLAALRKLRK